MCSSEVALKVKPGALKEVKPGALKEVKPGAFRR